ncbi:hypothetical protein HPB50_012331 [Hyalomma asiaticum]|uniref:Uncharacterized protein n=1 Tax=Hyalomma asiaticum TaxID=266040 RepID=A0ACB7TGS1_HYAAI|nr:hypothetical protein HPB50_012331 [Hyalomma asiaticum]
MLARRANSSNIRAAASSDDGDPGDADSSRSSDAATAATGGLDAAIGADEATMSEGCRNATGSGLVGGVTTTTNERRVQERVRRTNTAPFYLPLKGRDNDNEKERRRRCDTLSSERFGLGQREPDKAIDTDMPLHTEFGTAEYIRPDTPLDYLPFTAAGHSGAAASAEDGDPGDAVSSSSDAATAATGGLQDAIGAEEVTLSEGYRNATGSGVVAGVTTTTNKRRVQETIRRRNTAPFYMPLNCRDNDNEKERRRRCIRSRSSKL